ncbi:putative nicotinate-nucleotide adenylyltransferase [Gemmatimonadetes bacterium T265]|nr:putative nicotinate-nucleotide adenylyltransferase [Gemmatimonadetes bacterium T265]
MAPGVPEAGRHPHPSRVGIFGGSFDPPHVGHLLAASDAVEVLGLDRLLFVPAATQPLKHVGRGPAPDAARVAMLRALVGDDPRFAVDALEIERGGLSYTVDTLDTLAGRWPAARRFLLVGTDVLRTFDRWRDPLRVRALAALVVLVRGDDERAVPPDFPGGVPRLLPTRRVDVSSTEVRARVAAGRSVRGFVPDAVAAIIRDGRLYQ